nr:unnamed protein product [Callosobruchus analis]
MLLFRERLSFRMYVKNKKAKYGIKFFKLCAPNGYVGHHLVMDNYCNSDTLSQKLMEKCKTTHTIGTLMANRKQNPKVVTMPKLKKGEYIWKRRKGVYVSKWRDNRDVLAITTKYYPQLIEVRNRYGQVKIKPREISEYNNYMSGVDRCNQLTSYYSCPRKTIRWYKKIIFHLLDVTVLNAFIMYREKRIRK